MKAIVCVDKKWGIGRNNDLLLKIPKDMKRFKELTINNAVIMGRKTMETLNYKPLSARLNIVLTRDYNIYYPGFIFLHSEKELMKFIKDHDLADKSYVIGGSELYKTLSKYCMYFEVTMIDDDLNADTFIDNLDLSLVWVKNSNVSPITVYNNHNVYFHEYINSEVFMTYISKVVLKRELHPFEKVVIMATLRGCNSIKESIINCGSSSFNTLIRLYSDREIKTTQTSIDDWIHIQLGGEKVAIRTNPHMSNKLEIKKGDK